MNKTTRNIGAAAGAIIGIAIVAQVAWWGFVVWALWKLVHWIITK